MKRTPLQVRVPVEVHANLKKLAEGEHRTLNNYLSLLLAAHVERATSKEAQPA